jgi:hypothetical protein
MSADLRGRIAVVTGGGPGLGAADHRCEAVTVPVSDVDRHGGHFGRAGYE